MDNLFILLMYKNYKIVNFMKLKNLKISINFTIFLNLIHNTLSLKSKKVKELSRYYITIKMENKKLDK